MERITERNEKGEAYVPDCFREDTCAGTGSSEKCDSCKINHEVIERLAAYEDLEVTPDQIREIDRSYTELAQKMAKKR